MMWQPWSKVEKIAGGFDARSPRARQRPTHQRHGTRHPRSRPFDECRSTRLALAVWLHDGAMAVIRLIPSLPDVLPIRDRAEHPTRKLRKSLTIIGALKWRIRGPRVRLRGDLDTGAGSSV